MMKRLLLSALCCLFGASAFAQTGSLSPSPYLTIVDANGATVSGACVWTYVAGTSTPATTYTDKALSAPNTNPVVADSSGVVVIYLVPGSSYKYTVEQACTPPAHGVTIRTQDNIDAVASVTTATDISGVAGEGFSAGQVAYLSDGAGPGTVAGHWYRADNATSYSSIGVELGMTSAAIGSGQTGTFRQLGRVTGLSSLTVGAAYYVGTLGGLTTTPGTFRRHVGAADATTSLVFDDPAAFTPKTIVLNNAVAQTVTNTVTPTNVYSYSVPANTLGTYRALRLTMAGTYENNSGGNATLQLVASYGAQSFISGAGGLYTFATGTTTGPFRIDCLINANGSVSAQNALCSIDMVASGVPTNPRPLGTFGYNVPLTVNSANAQALVLQITHSVASAAIIYTLASATLEAIGQ